MNGDIRLSCEVFENHKVAKLKRRLGAEGVLCLFRLWTWTGKNRPTGILSGMDGEDIEIAAHWIGDPGAFMEQCLALRLVEVCDNNATYSIHEWDENQPWACGAAARSQKARKAARAKWERKLGITKCEERSENRNATSKQRACSEHAPSNAPSPILSSPILSSPDSNPLVLRPEESPAKDGPANCPHAEIVALYHEITNGPRVKVWSERRKRALRARWKEDPERQNLDWWRDFFGKVAANDFLSGRRHATGRDPFFASLEWLLQPEKFIRVVEGFYPPSIAKTKRPGGGILESWQPERTTDEVLREAMPSWCGESLRPDIDAASEGG